MSRTVDLVVSISTVVILIAFVAMVALKMTGVISWSWWFVTVPLWMPALVGFAVGFSREGESKS